MQEKGNISIHAENIFPIIKKWLYSDKDIFIRELISNRADADKIDATARAKGMASMLDDGLSKMAKGATTFEEVLRVIKTEEVDS